MCRPREQSIDQLARLAGTVLLVGFLAAALPPAASAADAGVSGIPLGPGNANGVNGTATDPSGIGNAGKIAPLPQPSMQPVAPPTAAPLVSTRPPGIRQGSARARNLNLQRAGPKAQAAAVKENDRLLDRGITSICRGC